LRIGHYLFPQRSSPGRDYLNYRLHSTLASAGNQPICNASLISRLIEKQNLLSANGAHSLYSLGHGPRIFENRSDQR
jgi:hypothetical protein